MKNLEGNIYGQLLVLEQVRDEKTNRLMWKCECQCNNKPITYVQEWFLLNGKTTSCGCLRTYDFLIRGESPCLSKEYGIWADMKKRRDGHCQDWDSFETFYRDMGECPEGHTLDRLLSNKRYEKDNCIWTPKTIKIKNKDATILNRMKAAFIKANKRLGKPIRTKRLATLFGCCEGAIYSCESGRTWKDVEPMPEKEFLTNKKQLDL